MPPPLISQKKQMYPVKASVLIDKRIELHMESLHITLTWAYLLDHRKCALIEETLQLHIYMLLGLRTNSCPIHCSHANIWQQSPKLRRDCYYRNIPQTCVAAGISPSLTSLPVFFFAMCLINLVLFSMNSNAVFCHSMLTSIGFLLRYQSETKSMEPLNLGIRTSKNIS